MIGQAVSHYRILEKLGGGGMGVVYKAEDTKLGRTVALKFLPEELARNEQALERFRREARAVASLSHPHICTLHEVGEEDGIVFLVMEHLEGETLAQRLARGPLPLEEVLRHAAEIAEALGEAHRRGIVHRDLKPGNVMLTRSGAKLLDFGLAKLRPPSGLAGTGEDRTLTAENTLVGTLPYMAPEQLEGAAVDARTDVFAFGTVIYEMATGVRAFAGSSQASLVASIMRGDVPSLVSRQPMTPPALDRLVGRCLRKDPADRWQSAFDVALRLREIASEDPRVTAPRGRSKRWGPALGAALLVGLLAGVTTGRWWRGTSRPRSAGPVVRSTVDLPSGTRLTADGFSRTEIAVSPGGTLLVWAGSSDGSLGSSVLYQRPLDGDVAKPVPGTEGGHQPFFSPDGRWIGFYDSTRRKLRKVPAAGGLAVDLAAVGVSAPMGDFWSADGRIYLGNESRGLEWIPAEGGAPRPLTKVDPAREVGHRLPWVLPGGKAILFTASTHFWGVHARVEALSLDNGARKVLVDDAADARYLASGHLVFARQGALMVAPFDAGTLELTGSPSPILTDVRQALNMGDSSPNSGAAQFAVSPSGLLLFAKGGIFEDPPGEQVLIDRAGRVAPLAGFDRPLTTGQARFSPDGRQIAFTEVGRSGLLWLFDVERQTHRPLSRDGIAGFPVWSPDGRRIAVGWSAAGPLSLWSLAPDGGGEWERLTDGDDLPSCWTPDGPGLLFVRTPFSQNAPGGADILMYRFDRRDVVPVLATRANERYPELSPDGRWLAYVSDESGRDEVLVTSFPDRKRTLVVSREGAHSPGWARDGRTLYFLPLGDWPGKLLGVSASGGEALTLGPPTAVFPLPPWTYWSAPVRGYDIRPDGQRFLFARLKREAAPPPPITQLHLVQNWFAELARLSPRER